MNLACRDSALRQKIVQDLAEEFKTVWSYKVPEEVNEILFCTNVTFESLKKSQSKIGHKQSNFALLLEAFGKINAHTKSVLRSDEELLDLDEALKQLKVVYISLKLIRYRIGSG